MTDFDDIPETALRWHLEGKGVALATVTQTWGSAPRPIGSQLAISADGEMAGSVSGGCVEGAVIFEAQDAIADGKPRLLDFAVSDDDAFGVGLACGGKIQVLVDPIGAGMSLDDLQAICAARAGRKPIAYRVNTRSWQRDLRSNSESELEHRFRDDKSGYDAEIFTTIFNPPLRMVVIGAVHIAQPLLKMAHLLGFDTLLVDPREAFASHARFPDVNIRHDWPDDALNEFGLDARTAVVALTHDPKIDDPALHQALDSNVFYIGALGSTRTHAKRVERLQENGYSDAQIARIHGPIGLNIGAKTPAEIAVSIVAEITERLRKAT